MHDRYVFLIALVSIWMPQSVWAAIKIVEGEKAQAMYEKDAEASHVLRQKNKIFHLKSKEGEKEKKPDTLNILKGETIFMTNEEQKYVHHIYDSIDHIWLIKQQQPSEIAALTFTEVGAHMLRCAIHSDMKIIIKVAE